MRVLSIGALWACLVLSACGGQPWCEPEGAGPEAGEGGGGGAGGTEAQLQAPQLTATVTYIKTFSFEWNAVPGATSYRLVEDIDGLAGPQAGRVIAELPFDGLSFSTEVFLPDRINASYQVQACNATGCAESAPTGIDNIDLGIGFFKASQVARFDAFGAGLAISADGHLLAVGVPHEGGVNAGIDSDFQAGSEGPLVGAVYVFRRDADAWVRDAYIKPDPVQMRGHFGTAVALAGDAQGYTLLVGAPLDGNGDRGVGADPNAALPRVPGNGAVYVFERAANGDWSQHSYIKPETPSDEAHFGDSVSLSQDRQWAAVGQPDSAEGGWISLYQRLPTGWVFRQALQGSNTESEDAFGQALQLDATGETLVAGARGEDGSAHVAGTATTDDDAASDAGAVYVFRRDGVTWEQTAYVKAPAPVASSAFGHSVALSSAGNRLVVGEPGAVVGAGPSLGKVHVFELVGSNWLHDLDFVSPVSVADGAFGARVALATDADGATLVIADPSEGTAGSGLTTSPFVDGPTSLSGSVFVYRRNGNGAWSAPVPVKAPNNRSDLQFGLNLALSANRGTLAVFGQDGSSLTGIGGTPSVTDQSAERSGAVYLY